MEKIDDPDVLREMFDLAHKKGTGKMDFTKEESEKFKSAFDQPEFRELLSKYMDELQDPRYREENEAYISQLEGENQVPSGKELIRPTAAFVAKTYKIDDSDNKKGDKVFINIVHSDKVTAPSMTSAAKGQNVSLPYSLGPPHMEKDTSDNNAVAFDCCVHPEAIKLGQSSKQFQEVLVQTAMDGIELFYKKQNIKTNIKREFHILKGVTYKSGQVPTMLVDKGSSNVWKDEKPATIPVTTTDTSAGADPSTNMSSTATATSTATVVNAVSSAGPAIKRGFLNKASTSTSNTSHTSAGSQSTSKAVSNGRIQEVKPASNSTRVSSGKLVPSAMAAASTPPAPPFLQPISTKHTSTSSTLSDGSNSNTILESASVIDNNEENKESKTPQFVLVERGVLGLGDFENIKSAVTSTRPAELIYRISLPLVKKASDVVLDVKEKALTLSYEDVYLLDIKLPYEVYSKKGSAKYDKKEKCLVVTLPVVAPAILRPESKVEVQDQFISSAVSEIGESFGVETTPVSTATPVPVLEKAVSSAANSHSRWVSSPTGSADTGSDLPEEVRQTLRTALSTAPPSSTSSISSCDAPHLEDSSTSALLSAKQPLDPVTAAVSPATTSSGSFIASASFTGKRVGYYFTSGPKGLGYYIDAIASPPTSTSTTSENQSSNSSETSTSTEKVETLLESLKPFNFEFRQMKSSIAILVDVPQIIIDSVDIRYTKTGLDIRFMATDESNMNLRSDVSDPKKSHGISYGLGLNTFGEIEPSKCKHDVANKNMVIILYKAVDEFWISPGGTSDSSNGTSKDSHTSEMRQEASSGSMASTGMLIRRPYISEKLSGSLAVGKQVVVGKSADGVTNSQTTATTAVQTSQLPISQLSSPVKKTIATEIQFSSTNILFELD